MIKKIEDLEDKRDQANSQLKQDEEMENEENLRANTSIAETQQDVTPAEQAMIDELLEIQSLQV